MKRSAMFGAGSVMLAAALAALPASAGAQTTVEKKELLIEASFNDGRVDDDNFIALGQTCLSGATDDSADGSAVAACAPDDETGPVPEAGKQPGYLQLTDASTYSGGGILYNKALENQGGFEVTFSQYQYGGTGADGISFFIADGETDLTEVGAYGGSLGYAQRLKFEGDELGDQDGVDGGYLGLGLDAWGNFSADTEGRGNGCTGDEQAPEHLHTDFNRAPDNVALRGPGQGTEGYCLLATSATDEVIGTVDNGDLYGSTFSERINADSLDSAKRVVKLKVTGDEHPTVSVDMKFLGGEEASGWKRVLETTMPTAAPDTFKLGFASSTGGATDVHLIRHLRVETFG
ncbi:lectin-like domain-containing protein [Glycomyces buryatensis]|uniref:Uncharacterized protein n=1 Tax=Glycomyces buryatensis TaxID=2570927 RepID=A0A4S8QFY5_9ACTN|nr:hypothetical protein [Glycomyces buryatensis]THV43338.1 hypothetical protein FAB82_01275 [Glycomyces buryatensis]